MNPENTLQRLEAEIAQLERAFDLGRSEARSTSRTGTIIALVICVTICGFLVANYFNVKSNWAHADFTRSLEQEIAEISPALERELRQLSRSLLPVYSREGRRQLLAFGPQAAERLEDELDLLSADFLTMVHSELGAMQERVWVKAEHQIYQVYPSLTQAQDRAEIEARVHALTEDALAGAIGNFERRYSKEVDDLETVLTRFDISDSGEDVVDLQKKFIHLWLRVLDQELGEL